MLVGSSIYGAVEAPTGRGYVDVSTIFSLNPSTGNRNWSVFLNDAQPELDASATAVFVIWDGSTKAGVYAVNADSGATLWKQTWTHSAIQAAPVASGNLVYVSFAQGGPNRFSPSVCALNAANGNVVWCHNVGVSLDYSPAIANAVVYASGDGKSVALDAATGHQIWAKSTKPASASPVVDGSRVYIGAGYEVNALATSNGAMVWTYTSPKEIYQLLSSNGTLYVSSDGGNVDAVDENTGAQSWNYHAADVGGPSLLMGSGSLYAGGASADQSNFEALDPTTGAAQWTHATTTIYAGALLGLESGMLYVLGDPVFLAMNATTGVEGWSFVTNQAVSSPPVSSGTAGFVGASDYHVYAFDATTGTVSWRYRTNGPITSQVAIYGDKLFAVGSAPDDNVYALDNSNGQSAWTKPFPGDLVSANPAADGSRVFVGTEDGIIYALSQATGTQSWKVTLAKGPTVSSLAAANGVLYVAASNVNCGCRKHKVTIVAMNEATGAHEWTVAVSGIPGPLVVANGAVYFPSNSGSVLALNAANGHKLWGHSFKPGNWTSIAASATTVYVGSSSKVYALAASNGHAGWTKSVGRGLDSLAVSGSTVLAGAGHLYALHSSNGHAVWTAGNGDGTEGSFCGSIVCMGAVGPRIGGVYGLDTASGHTIWTIPTAREPDA